MVLQTASIHRLLSPARPGVDPEALDLAAWVARVRAALRRERLRRRVLAELQSRTDRELADMGLRRDRLRETAREAAASG